MTPPTLRKGLPLKPFRPQRLLRYHWLRLLRVKGDPYALARGVFIGTFVGVTPTIPFHTAAILLLAPLIRGNLISAFLANWIVSNPVSIPIEYYLSWKIGSLLVTSNASWVHVKGAMAALLHSGIFGGLEVWSSLGRDIVLPLLAGGVVVALPVAVASYFLFLYAYFMRQRRRMKALLARYQALQGDTSRGDE